MSTWEAIFSTASYVLPNGGLPALIWMYVVTVFGFGAAIFSMAEMASMAPTSGGQYHWVSTIRTADPVIQPTNLLKVSEFAPKSSQKVLSYITGWLCVLGWQSGVAAQCFTVALQVQGLIILNNATYVPQPWHAVLLTIATVTVAAIFNTFLARKLPLIENFVLVLHVCGFFAILIPLWVLAPRTPSEQVWTGLTQDAGWPSVGLACLVGLTGPLITLIGPDSAVHMAEEVRDASRVLPWAMVSTLVLNGVSGFIMAITFAYCIGPLDQAVQPPYFFAFIGTFFTATGSYGGTTVMTLIIVIMIFCSAIANVATASRQMFAFARDRGLPFADFVSYVSVSTHPPRIHLADKRLRRFALAGTSLSTAC